MNIHDEWQNFRDQVLLDSAPDMSPEDRGRCLLSFFGGCAVVLKRLKGADTEEEYLGKVRETEKQLLDLHRAMGKMVVRQ